MPYPIEDKLVIVVASSALFDLSESDRVFRTQGEKAYRKHQEAHLDVPLEKGVAFPLVRRFLGINQRFPDKSPVEVVLLSRNSAIQPAIFYILCNCFLLIFEVCNYLQGVFQ